MTFTVRPVIAAPPADGYSYLPRLSIEHKSGELMFNDSALNPRQMSKIIMLGGTRTRTMFNWGTDAGEQRGLECESKDFTTGNPTELFPWGESNFDQDIFDGTHLDCGSCVFANWTKDPTSSRGSKAARCTEQVSGIFLVPAFTGIETTTGDGITSLEYGVTTMEFKKSSLREVNDYLKQFKIKKSPPYVALTKIKLDTNLGTGFKYSVPKLTKHGEVERESFPLLSAILQAGRDLLLKPSPRVTKPTGFFEVEAASNTDTVYTGAFFS